ncbi:hypothetical protein GCM10027591_02690 [Zhihengliuella somnathii]
MKKSGSVGAVAAVALVLSGCTGTTPEPTESPSASSAAPTTSAPASPTPEPATSTSPAQNMEPPVMPDLAKEFSAEGFEAFVEYWFEARNYAVATGDVSLMDEVSHAECSYCQLHKRGISEIYEAGGWVDGGYLNPSDFFTNLRELQGEVFHAGFSLEQEEGAAYGRDGQQLEAYTFTPGTYEYEMMALYDEQWKAAIIDLPSDAEE